MSPQRLQLLGKALSDPSPADDQHGTALKNRRHLLPGHPDGAIGSDGGVPGGVLPIQQQIQALVSGQRRMAEMAADDGDIPGKIR